MNNQKWYNKTWFMWLLLIICWPIGIIFLYRHRNDYTVKKLAYIAVGTLFVYILLTSFSTMNQPKRSVSQSEQSTTTSTTTSATTSPQKEPAQSDPSSTPNYAKLSADRIAVTLNVPSVDLNIKDFWSMAQDTGLTEVKGTFNLDNRKHTFRSRFVTGTDEMLLLKIDDKKIFFREDRQDEVMDEHSAKKKK